MPQRKKPQRKRPAAPTSKGPQVACPKCGRRQPPVGTPDAWYWCRWCRGYFDNDPDEGGDFANDPTRRAEQQERRGQ